MANQLIGSKTITTAGTQLQFTTLKLRVLRAYFKPNVGNSGANIFVGDSTVSSTNGMSRSDKTLWGEPFVYDPVTVSSDEFWGDVATSGDIIDYLFVLGKGRGSK
jgi:hypothetical protein